MDEQMIRDRAESFRQALLAGDMGEASVDMSSELQRNLGPVVAMLPLPLTDATLETVESTGSGYRALLSLVGESGTIKLETRWKERDGHPTMVEASHVRDEPMPTAPAEDEDEAGG